jgi:DNA-binding NtrC family response regulator
MMSRKVLVADDDPDVREIVRRRLESDGHRVEIATDGVQAVKACRDVRFDVVVTDLNMPGLSGVEVIRRVKESCPQTVTIVLTGFGAMESAVEALRLGCDDYQLKPLNNLDEFVFSMEQCLARRDALAELTTAGARAQSAGCVVEWAIKQSAGCIERLKRQIDRLAQHASRSDDEEGLDVARSMLTGLRELFTVLSSMRSAYRSVRRDQ